MEDIVVRLTKMLIEQSIKDKKEGRIECISKVKALQSLIKLIKEEEIETNGKILEEENKEY
jgi:hypothetical protein